MGMRGELFTSQVVCEGRTYFFNVKENRMGDLFLAIVESKPTESESFDRRSIVIFKEDMKGFLKAFQSTLSYMEKNGATAPAMDFNPEPEAPRPARRRPVGSGSSAGPGGPDAAAPAKKRRVVVKRAKPEGGAAPDSSSPGEE